MVFEPSEKVIILKVRICSCLEQMLYLQSSLASIPIDYLNPTPPPTPHLDAAVIITHWLFRPPLQKLTFTRAHSSLEESEIGMPIQIRLLPLLKV